MLGLLFSSDRGKLDTETHTKALPPNTPVFSWYGFFVLSADTGGTLIVTRIGFIATLLLNSVQPHFEQNTPPTPVVESTVHATAFVEPEVAQLREQLKVPYTMPVPYWEEVAQCETRQNWQDGGHYSGGLGIALSTWKAYGGREFASRPSKATKLEQVFVANRIAVTGFQTRHTYMGLDQPPFFRPRAGFFGWGCIKHNRYLHPDVWRNNHRKVWAYHKKHVQSTP